LEADHASSALDSLCHTYMQKREIDYPNVAQSHIDDIAIIECSLEQLEDAELKSRYTEYISLMKSLLNVISDQSDVSE
ncbi:MAG: hypothetical protein ABIR47_06740, partial [Candidatus Kapaibacterium sp.]